ncbi:DUF5686 and carboxypeptidase regulatory-like domain-containing protein [Flavisolibacter tropicus]|uniref:Carboxypeptidase-like regulatory domain-containing protein n=1 Tax=Flavisolibacter tropicus TaxID=1492898 RepID=A0A172TWM9_9BACT|nr:DUF5686 and carboxypeptidase regulatory-like domain-containing protein [Flavisolibacter tropicus]ANE51284.1 hypothetical protein SY85_12950 [Flavisolibacter tropicus]
MNKLLFLLFSLTLALGLQAQTFKLQGKAVNSRQEGIPYVTIQVQEFQTGGLVTRQDGSYELSLARGTYRLQITAVGYISQEISITIDSNMHKDIVLEDAEQSLGEVIVRAKAKDRADEVMRQVVRKKDSIQAAAGPYSCNVYIKALEESDSRSQAKKDTGSWEGMSMAEIMLKLDVESESRIKEERLGVRQNGTTSRLFYLSATDGNFNFFNNLVKVPSISQTPFLSPISNSGLIAYHFKTTKVKRNGKHRIYTISVKPLEVTNATVEGEVTVSDSAWTVMHARFRFPSYHLQEFDFFEVEQDFDFVNDQAWMMTRQQFTYRSKDRKNKYAGHTTASYSQFELNKTFDKRHFKNELSATASKAYQQDSIFWEAVRTPPLTASEARFVRYSDSLAAVARTERYLDSLDRKINKLTWMKMGFFGQSLNDHRKERTWHFTPLISLYRPFAYGGGRLGAGVYYGRTFPSRKMTTVNVDLSYGLRNNDVNGTVDLYRRYNTFKLASYTLEAGRDFAFISEGDALINMVKRNNIYLNNYLGAGHAFELVNGLFIFSEAQMAFRRSVAEYKTGKLVDSLFNEVLTENQPVAFNPYNALYSKIKVEYTPMQRYRRDANEKIILGSKWPTLFVQWEKGIPNIAGSEVNFDYLEFGLKQVLNVGLLGVSRYTVRSGSFLNKTDLRLIDYKVQRRGDPLLFMDPHKAFQALDSSFSLFNRFVDAHFFHQFNGLFVNKIPLLKKLKLREVAGTGFLYAPERDLRYVELFAGLERAFESPFNPMDKFKVGIYVVTATSNQFKDPVQFKIGFTTWDKRKNRWR